MQGWGADTPPPPLVADTVVGLSGDVKASSGKTRQPPRDGIVHACMHASDAHMRAGVAANSLLREQGLQNLLEEVASEEGS